VDVGPLPFGTSLLTPASEPEMITSISLRDYHKICGGYLARPRYDSDPPNVSVKIGSIHYSSGSEYENSLEVASSDCSIADSGWATIDPIVENGLHPYVPSQCVCSDPDKSHKRQNKL
jgi:hypothetical protein